MRPAHECIISITDAEYNTFGNEDMACSRVVLLEFTITASTDAAGRSAHCQKAQRAANATASRCCVSRPQRNRPTVPANDVQAYF